MDNEMNLELGEMLEQRIQENFGSNDTGNYDVFSKCFGKRIPEG